MMHTKSGLVFLMEGIAFFLLFRYLKFSSINLYNLGIIELLKEIFTSQSLSPLLLNNTQKRDNL
jgi:hypothetical protein